MDISTLMKIMLSQNSTSAVSQNTGVSSDVVSGVLASVLPSLLSGASAQAKDEKTAASFAQALASHGQKDTMDLASFFGGVDKNDGEKIVAHLLGGNAGLTAQNAAKQTGATEAQVSNIMANIAPLLMSILGQQNGKQQASGLAAILGGAQPKPAASPAAGLASLLGGAQPKPAASQANGSALIGSLMDGIDAGDVISIIGKLMK